MRSDSYCYNPKFAGSTVYATTLAGITVPAPENGANAGLFVASVSAWQARGLPAGVLPIFFKVGDYTAPLDADTPVGFDDSFGAADQVSELLALIRNMLPALNDPDRTWNMQRTGTFVGSDLVRVKRVGESSLYWANVASLLSPGEKIGDAADITVVAGTATVVANSIGSLGVYLFAEFTGGTVAAPMTTTWTFKTTEGATFSCDAPLQILA